MSSRQEEKERRRKEREALEAAARKSSDARKRIGIVAIVVAAVAAIAVIGVVVVGGGDDGGGSGSGPGGGGETAKAPTQNVDDLDDAVAAAGCKLERHKNEGSSHTTDDVKYGTNPPTSGNHDPNPAEDGLYEPGNPPDVERSVHALEHGRINVQYKPGSPPERIAQLRGMVDEEVKGTKAYKTLFFENQTGMTAAVAATAWTRSLTCPQWNDKVFDAIRNFRSDFVDKGPEFIP
jgi:hypothetical protein